MSERLLAIDFKKAKLSEMLGAEREGTITPAGACTAPFGRQMGRRFDALRPIDFIGRYMATVSSTTPSPMKFTS